MKVHTNVLTRDNFFEAADEAGVTINSISEHGSRSHARSFNVYLEGSSSRQSNGRDHKAATWDEWGHFMSILYTEDRDAMWGSKAWGYQNVDDFNFQTQNRFECGTPASDPHAQHKWQYDHALSNPLSGVSRHYCTGCSAQTARR